MLKDKTKWYGVVSAGVFIVTSIYLNVKWEFESAQVAGWLALITILAAIATLILGLLSLPRWQSFFALGVFVYALYWFTKPAYMIP